MKKYILYILAIAILQSSVAIAQNIQLDNSFGINGYLTVPNTAETNAMVEQADEKIITAGYDIDGVQTKFQVVRHLPNGNLDVTFASNGIAQTPIGIFQDLVYDVAIQSDGKIVAVGTYQDYQLGPYYTAICRYNTNGQLDSTFGNYGIVRLIFGTDNGLTTIKIQADQKIIVGGYAQIGLTNQFTIARLGPTGLLDSSFGINGIVVTTFPNNSVIYDMLLAQNGSIYACGYEGNAALIGFPDTRLVVSKYNANGSLNNAFATGGLLTISLDTLTFDCATQLNELSSGNILISGVSNAKAAVLEVDTNGILNPNFGVAGIIIYASQPNLTSTNILPNSKILISGIKNILPFDAGISLIQLKANGTLDSTFGTNGIYESNLTTGNDYVQATIIRANGKYLCAGSLQAENLLVQYVLGNSTSSSSLLNIENVSLYPNPTQNQIQLDFQLKNPQEISIDILSMKGQLIESLVKNEMLPAEKHSLKINTSHLAAGTYLLTIQSKNNVRSKKIVVQ